MSVDKDDDLYSGIDLGTIIDFDFGYSTIEVDSYGKDDAVLSNDQVKILRDFAEFLSSTEYSSSFMDDFREFQIQKKLEGN